MRGAIASSTLDRVGQARNPGVPREVARHGTISVVASAASTAVSEADFHEQVIEASHQVPVVVDFWAPWCGPCRQLTPVLEEAVAARDGAVKLVTVNTDENPYISQEYGIQGIPAVKGIRDGRIVGEFVGVQPRRNVDLFLDGLVPSEADLAAKGGDEAALRKALEAEPRHLDARLALGRLLLQQGRPAEAVEVLREAAHDPIGAGILARAELAAEPSGDPEAAEALALYEQDPEAAFERLLEAVTSASGDRRDRLRAVTVGLFGERGADDPLTVKYRRRLATALY
jgi:putative thioredoxin